MPTPNKPANKPVETKPETREYQPVMKAIRETALVVIAAEKGRIKEAKRIDRLVPEINRLSPFGCEWIQKTLDARREVLAAESVKPKE